MSSSSSALRQRLKERKAQVRNLIAQTQSQANAVNEEATTVEPTPSVTVTSLTERDTGEPLTKCVRLESSPSLTVSASSSQTSTTAHYGDNELLVEIKDSDESLPNDEATTPLEMDSIEALLEAPTAKEKESMKVSSEIQDLLNKPTAKELALIEKFKSDGSTMREFCQRGTKQDCARKSAKGRACAKLHFRKIIQQHTDVSLGDCSFLNTCFHMDFCKYIHYEVDYGSSSSRSRDREKQKFGIFPTIAMESRALLCSAQFTNHTSGDSRSTLLSPTGEGGKKTGALDSATPTTLLPAQWVQCDLRFIDLSVFGKFSVVMADPPWDIHMELPYGTMADDEMRRMNIQCLQDEGAIFLWVTGRAMELGRECLRLWGYRQVDEIVWVKTNQLQRIIRTGRTGHWLNHGKEHCLIGIKGCPEMLHRGLDCDVIVGEVRATSHKPDEIYGLIERMSPGTRKIELFGREHNVQPNWITLGNQLDGVRIVDADTVSRFKERYPDGNCLPKPDEIKRYKEEKERRMRDKRC